jgi:prefoldin subunit 5
MSHREAEQLAQIQRLQQELAALKQQQEGVDSGISTFAHTRNTPASAAAAATKVKVLPMPQSLDPAAALSPKQSPVPKPSPAHDTASLSSPASSTPTSLDKPSPQLPPRPTRAPSFHFDDIFAAGDHPPSSRPADFSIFDILDQPQPSPSPSRPHHVSHPSLTGSGSFGGAMAIDATAADLPRRTKVRNEIVATERSYLNSLSVLKQVWVDPLKERAVSLRVSLPHVAVFIAHVDPVIALHQAFALSMDQVEADGAGIAALFLTTIPYFKMYWEYVHNYARVIALLRALQHDNQPFADFVAEAQADPRMGGRMLADLYIAPVQRLPRYVLLLKELLKVTEAALREVHDGGVAVSSPRREVQALQTELTLTREALVEMERCARGVNEAQREIEGRARLREVSTRLGRRHASLSLSTPTRRLVMEEEVQREKKGRGKPARVLLCTDMLLWMTDYEFKGAMPLSHVSFRASNMQKPAYSRAGIDWEAVPTTSPVSEWFLDILCAPMDPSAPSSPTPARAQPTAPVVLPTLTKDLMFPPVPGLAPAPASQSNSPSPAMSPHNNATSASAPSPTHAVAVPASASVVDRTHWRPVVRLLFDSEDQLMRWVCALTSCVDDADVHTQAHRRSRSINKAMGSTHGVLAVPASASASASAHTPVVAAAAAADPEDPPKLSSLPRQRPRPVPVPTPAAAAPAASASAPTPAPAPASGAHTDVPATAAHTRRASLGYQPGATPMPLFQAPQPKPQPKPEPVAVVPAAKEAPVAEAKVETPAPVAHDPFGDAPAFLSKRAR